MIMSTVSSAPAAAQRAVGPSWACGPVAILQRWCATYLSRRADQVAIGQLWSMSDGELKDIGLTRSEIERAVAGAVPRGRASTV